MEGVSDTAHAVLLSKYRFLLSFTFSLLSIASGMLFSTAKHGKRVKDYYDIPN